ncbi:TadE family type IV pilus minor pilin [Cellulomonas cellasea]|uniref:TadE family type IV pilus minor pilin n=1 Tax=Cellulomonas cellasea TaxID=43670 RepID=UPI0025A46F80|nr:TadE family type IV pilus minor pilin [Cellulomonas cellasea]MDM8085599.1 TadE family type IV pilus minor pilin [Cellulomonas cellasea]
MTAGAAGREGAGAGGGQGRGRQRAEHEGERGSVTAELAVALPAVAVLLTAVLVLTAAATTQLRCADAARAGARSAALGEGHAVVVAQAARVAGPGSAVEVAHDGEWVTVTVRSAATAGALSVAPVRVSGKATARVEP